MRFYKPQKGASLPTLTKPAGPADIVLNKEAINGSGQKIVGKLDIDQAFTINGNAEIPLETFNVINGIKALKVVGSLGTATAADIVKGKNAFTDAGFVEGTLEVSGFDTTQYMDAKVLGYDELNVLDDMSIVGINDWKLCYIKEVLNTVGSFYTPENLVSYIVGGDQLQYWADIGFTSSSIQFTAKPGQSFKMRQLFTNIIVFFPPPPAPEE